MWCEIYSPFPILFKQIIVIFYLLSWNAYHFPSMWCAFSSSKFKFITCIHHYNKQTQYFQINSSIPGIKNTGHGLDLIQLQHLIKAYTVCHNLKYFCCILMMENPWFKMYKKCVTIITFSRSSTWQPVFPCAPILDSWSRTYPIMWWFPRRVRLHHWHFMKLFYKITGKVVWDDWSLF